MCSFSYLGPVIRTLAHARVRSWRRQPPGRFRRGEASLYRKQSIQLAPQFAFSRFGVEASGPLMRKVMREQGLLCGLEGLQDAQSMLAVRCAFLQSQPQHDLLGELLQNAHVIGTAAGALVVMSDPDRALCTTAAGL